MCLRLCIGESDGSCVCVCVCHVCRVCVCVCVCVLCVVVCVCVCVCVCDVCMCACVCVCVCVCVTLVGYLALPQMFKFEKGSQTAGVLVAMAQGFGISGNSFPPFLMPIPVTHTHKPKAQERSWK